MVYVLVEFAFDLIITLFEVVVHDLQFFVATELEVEFKHGECLANNTGYVCCVVGVF